jgi:SAM-dependent methyltransferase
MLDLVRQQKFVNAVIRSAAGRWRTNVCLLMQELHRIAKPNGKLVIRCPHGASDDAWEDPTHVRAFFARSFGYFSQPFYWLADYGYRGDWQPAKIVLKRPGPSNMKLNSQDLDKIADETLDF